MRAPDSQLRLRPAPERVDQAERAPALPGGADIALGELFCGAGGMALGAAAASGAGYRFVHAWVTDADADACRTISQLVAPARVHCSPVAELDLERLPAVDGLVFGFPCNDFSAAGKRRGLTGRFGDLYAWGVRALDVFRPLFFVAENVGGIASSNAGRDFQRILAELEEAGPGYALTVKLYKFEEYGVPQRRHRYIIVGFAAGSGMAFRHPSPARPALRKPPTAAAALADIPAAAPNHEMRPLAPLARARLNHIRPGENAYTADIPERLKLKMKSGALISSIYRRLRPDEPAYTVTAAGGGGTHMYHWDEPRALTNRERARLQTFPDSHKFYGSAASARRQIGMAVPPRGAAAVFHAVGQQIAEARRRDAPEESTA